jgi:hypothetical protein
MYGIVPNSASGYHAGKHGERVRMLIRGGSMLAYSVLSPVLHVAFVRTILALWRRLMCTAIPSLDTFSLRQSSLP